MQKILGFYQTYQVRIEKTMNIIGVSMIMIMMVLISADAFGRSILNSPIQGGYETGQLLMIFLVFLGLAYTQGVRGHIRVDMFVDHLSGQGRVVAELIANIAMLTFAGLVTWGGVTEAIYSWQVKEATFGVIAFPVYPSRTMVAIGGLVLCFRSLLDIMSDIFKLKTGIDIETPGESAEALETREL